MSYLLNQLTGSECLFKAGLVLSDATVLDFWRWAFGNLCANDIRGIFAEWMVARLLGILQPPRDSWKEWDLITPGGVTIEVKASAYLQTWSQKRPSKIKFTDLKGRKLDPYTNQYDQTATYNADLYVFCIQIEQDVASWNALDLDQWRFYLLSSQQVAKLNYQSISLATLGKVSQEMNADEFRQAAEVMISAAPSRKNDI